ncbi:hypothetical protein V8E54_011363 [Elaphomyces granulatus]
MRGTQLQSRGMATTLSIEFGGWGFDKLPLRVQKMILRQIRIAQGWRVAGRRPLGDMVDVPGWCDPGVGLTNGGESTSASIPRSMPRIPTAQEFGEPADRKRPKQSRLTTIRRSVNQGEAAGPDRVYRVVVNFYLSHYNIVDELIQYTRIRIIESVGVQLPSVPIGSLDQLISEYLLPLMDASQTRFLRLASDKIRLATKITKLVPVYLPREASHSRTTIELLTRFFKTSGQDYTINVIILRQEPDCMSQGGRQEEEEKREEEEKPLIKREKGGKRGGKKKLKSVPKPVPKPEPPRHQ